MMTRNVEQAIAEAARQYSNWGRWGDDDVLGTLNHLDDDKRRAAGALIRDGRSFSLSLRMDWNGPQRGHYRRTNPLHVMLSDGLDASGLQPLPHGFGVADDMISMPLQASTQWDGLGHIFDHGIGWQGRRSVDVVSAEQGDRVTGIQTVAHLFVGRGVLLDVGRALGRDGELPDGFAITGDHLDETAARQGVQIERGDIVLVRTGQLARAYRDGWGEYAGGDAPGMSFWSAGWLHDSEIAALATDTWGFEVRPNEFEGAMQPLHQVVIPHLGLFIGEMWDLEALADDCAADSRYTFFLTAAPLPFTGAVGGPLNPIAVK